MTPKRWSPQFRAKGLGLRGSDPARIHALVPSDETMAKLRAKVQRILTTAYADGTDHALTELAPTGT